MTLPQAAGYYSQAFVIKFFPMLIIKFLSLCLLLVVFSHTQAATPIQPFSVSKVVDLTHVMHDEMAFWPGGVPFKKEQLVSYENGGYLLHQFVMGENTGTHVDAPSHFIKGKRSIDELPIDQLILPIVVIDVRAQVEKDPDYELSFGDIKRWERQYGRIPPNTLVIMNSGWHKRFTTPKKYINKDRSGVMHFPGYSPEAAKLLVKRNVAGIGIDTLSLDHGPSKTFATHHIMLGADKYQIENMTNLNALPPTGANAVIGVLPVREGSQAQARIFALLP